MGKINVLDRQTADLIAAGEVVERPASAAKELIENSIDAGATAMTVEIKNGGISFLRVTDNGSGIAREDIATAFLRHATSKISGADDLEAIATMGFRGEALAAISSVSRVDLITKTPHDDCGVKAYVEAGELISVEDCGCPDGTTMIVRTLFFNTPARMKFLKKDAAEGSAVQNVVERAAMSHPEISFRFIKDGQTVFTTPGDGKALSVIYMLWGSAIGNDMLPISEEYMGIKVTGFTCVPERARGNRNLQCFFINGRPIRSKLLTAALEEGYRDNISSGKFPIAAVYLEIDYTLVDVNIHPTKSEIKFANEKTAFEAVYYAVKNAVVKKTARPEFIFEKENKQEKKSVAADPVASFYYSEKSAQNVSAPSVKISDTHEQKSSVPDVNIVFQKQAFANDSVSAQAAPIEQIQQKADVSVPQEQILAEEKQQTIEEIAEAVGSETPLQAKSEPQYRIIGEAMKTYIVVEADEQLWLVDKHAAHERILYERLRAHDGDIGGQQLLIPITISLSADEIANLLESREYFERMGYEFEQSGRNEVALRAVPTSLNEEQAKTVFTEMNDSLMKTKSVPDSETLDRMLYSAACKAAVKGGVEGDMSDNSRIIRLLFENEDIRHCPHGRPVAVIMTKQQIEKQFKRT